MDGGASKIDLKEAIDIASKEASNGEQVILTTGLNKAWDQKEKIEKI